MKSVTVKNLTFVIILTLVAAFGVGGCDDAEDEQPAETVTIDGPPAQIVPIPAPEPAPAQIIPTPEPEPSPVVEVPTPTPVPEPSPLPECTINEDCGDVAKVCAKGTCVAAETPPPESPPPPEEPPPPEPESPPQMVGKFPSTLVAIFNAGGYKWAKPADPETLALVPDEYKDKEVEWVKKWQLDHADICLACEEFTPKLNKEIISLDYDYYQVMREDTRFEETEMRKKLIIDGKAGDWEGLFLHFNVDTFVDTDEICESKTSWTGRPVVGYLNDNNKPGGEALTLDDPVDPDKPNIWNLDVFANNGALYVGMPEKFAGIKIDVGGGNISKSEKGSLIFEYAAGIETASMTSTDIFSPSSKWVINKWNKLTVTDGTANFIKDGSINFRPPSDWVWGTPYPAWFPGSSTIGNLLAYGSGRYMIRIRVNNLFNKPPILNRITTSAWITLEDINGKKAVKIPGWDPDNDINKNGYIDYNEIMAPTYNNKASARFIHEGRVAQVCTLGKGSNPTWGRYAPNLWNQDYIDLRAEFTANLWKKTGLTGNYNDNANVLLWGSFSHEPLSIEADNGPAILSGGSTIEGKALGYGDGGVRNPIMTSEYAKAFINLWSQIKKKAGSKWIGINTVQPYRYPLMKPFVESDTFDVIINENTIRAVSPYSENMGAELYGLSRLWFIPAMNKAGKKFIMPGYFDPEKDGLLNTEEGWKRRKEALLAVYYLWNIPGMTVFTPTHEKYEEGGNTGTEMYYKAGVPYDMALQPTGMLEANIGTPSHAPDKYSLVPYLGCVPFNEPYKYCNIIVGYSDDKSLLLNGYGLIETLPTNQYFLYAKYEGEDGVATYLKGGVASGTLLAADMVIARSYTNGIVLYRTSYKTLANKNDFSHYANFNKITISLPDIYQRVLPDGTLAEPSNTIKLRGYEGAILKKPED